MFLYLFLKLSDQGTEVVGETGIQYSIRENVPRASQLTQPVNGPKLNLVKRPKRSCNACWHPINRIYDHKHCREALHNMELPVPTLELELKIKNL